MKVEWVDQANMMSKVEHEAACDCCKNERVPVVRVKALHKILHGMSQRLKEYKQDENLLGYLEALDDVQAMIKEQL